MITYAFLLTAFRLFGSLFLLPPLFLTYLPLSDITINLVLAAFFVGIAVTDFFDGYCARKYGQVTTLGALFDPLADKIFVMVTLVTLLAVGKIDVYWVVLLLSREFFIMGLRELALHNGFVLSVGYSGKCKTAVQMFALTVCISNPYQALGSSAPWWNGIELFLLGLATVLAFISAFFYFCDFIKRV